MAMNKVSVLLCSSILLAVAACGENPNSGSNSAEDFAARINGGTANEPAAVQAPAQQVPAQADQQALAAPTVAAPLPVPTPGPYVPGTWTDPESSICGANLMEDFIGMPADEATREAIKIAAAAASEVQFVEVTGATIYPDASNPRLSIMIDNLGIIRDARCG
jgi:hypothetical protein